MDLLFLRRNGVSNNTGPDSGGFWFIVLPLSFPFTGWEDGMFVSFSGGLTPSSSLVSATSAVRVAGADYKSILLELSSENKAITSANL